MMRKVDKKDESLIFFVVNKLSLLNSIDENSSVTFSNVVLILVLRHESTFHATITLHPFYPYKYQPKSGQMLFYY